MTPLFPCHTADAPAKTALFLSGAGSNAEAILKYEKSHRCAFRTTLIVTDAPDTSRAAELAETYDLPLFGLDLKKFYLEHGETSIKLDTPRRRELRDLWSNEIYNVISYCKIELVLLAGFVPLTNLAEKIPSLNVHPGDLTLENADGSRMLAGLHFLPVERAILAGHAALRSSVILVQGYHSAKDIDAGPVIGISGKLPLDLEGHSVAELQQIFDARRPGEKADDLLRALARKNVEKLKTTGDHIVFPAATDDFARGAYAVEDKQLWYDGEKVSVVEYRNDGIAIHRS